MEDAQLNGEPFETENDGIYENDDVAMTKEVTKDDVYS